MAPIKQILSNPEVTRRLLKWSFKLEEHDIHYRLRTSVKGQILADFIVEHPKDDSTEDKEELPDPWILFTDGSLGVDGSGAGLILTSPKGTEFPYALRFRFDTTNNKAGYKALIAGLRIAEQIGVKNLQANVDLRLVANKVNGTYITKESGMIKQTASEEKSMKDHASCMSVLGIIHLKNGAKSYVSASFASVKASTIQRLGGKGKQEFRLRIKASNGETPFSLTYETEAVIPVEISMPTLRTAEVDMIKNDEALEINLDLLEEKREQAVIQEAKSKAKMEKYYNARVRNTSFRPGDFVYRNNEASHAEEGGRVGPKRKGPYKVT
ncbi:reverse transcriptase domain-containing protein [Tanacetum coccineum]